MILKSRVKPRHRDTRNVPFHDALYTFVKHESGEFICDVENEAHALALEATGAFARVESTLKREFKQADAPSSGNAGNQGGDEGNAGGADNTGTGDESPSYDASTQDEALALVDGSVADIGKAIGSVSSMDVVRCALRLEQSPDGKQRKTVVQMLETTIEHARQAGVE